MEVKVALDSNTLTYLIDSWSLTDNLFSARSEEYAQHVALLRIFLYTKHQFFLPPTTKNEYLSIHDPKKLELHASTNRVLIDDIREYDVHHKDLEFLMEKHPKKKDCKIFSEACSGGMDALLSNDAKFISRLNGVSGLTIVQPSKYWENLDISINAKPVTEPHHTNPLVKQVFWKW